VTGKRAGKVAVVVLLLALGGTGCGRQKAEEVLAKVEGKPITRDQLFEEMERADNGDAGRRALDALIVRQLLRTEADKKGVKVDAKEVEQRLEGMRDYVLAGTGKDFATWLQGSGQTEQEIRDSITRQMITAKLVLTDRERQQYFESHAEDLKGLPHNNEAVIYRQIVVATREEAEAVRNELVKAAGGKGVTGEEFGKLAEQRSLDPMTRTRGGMRGWWAKGKGDLLEGANPELEKVLFSLKPGEVGEPLAVKARTPSTAEGGTGAEAPEQWRIVMVDKRNSPRKPTLAGNADVIEEWMLSDPAYQPQFQQFIENLRAKATIEVLAPRYKALGEAYARRREARDRARSAGPTMAPQAPAGRAPAGRAPAAPRGGAGRQPGR